MQEVLGMARRLKTDLPVMLEEHRQIVDALDQLRAAARGRPARVRSIHQSADLAAQTEEQVLYPAAILLGE